MLDFSETGVFEKYDAKLIHKKIIMAEKKNEDGVTEIQNAISKTEAFIEKNRKVLIYSVIAILAVACLVFLVKKFYLDPRSEEAQSQLSKGIELMGTDSIKQALEGRGDYMGFEAIADEYGSTDAGNLAKMYAAECLYNQGQYEKALKYAKDFDYNDAVNVGPATKIFIGDCCVNLEKYDEAVASFKKAAEMNNPALSAIALKKLGSVLEEQKKYDEAVDAYTRIKNAYPQSNEAQDIEKYIWRAQNKVDLNAVKAAPVAVSADTVAAQK